MSTISAKMKSSLSLTEELLSQGLESDLSRIILTVQSVVNIINNKLRSLHSDSEEQLISWANQVEILCEGAPSMLSYIS